MYVTAISREFKLAREQPILKRARRRRALLAAPPRRPETDFWRSFNLDKLARDWRRGPGRARA